MRHDFGTAPRTRTFALALVAACVLTAMPARADAQTLQIASATPANGAVIAPTTSIAFTVESPAAAAEREAYLFVEVATQPTLGQDGTLGQEYTVETVGLQQGDAFPNRFTGSSSPYPFAWPGALGTYYWMAYCFCLSGGGRPLVSPIYTLTIGQPPPAPVQPPTATDPISDAEAAGYVRAAIRRQFHRTAYALTGRCRAVTLKTARCSVAWRDMRRSRRTTFLYRGTLTFRTLDDATYTSGFSGKRARSACVKTRSYKRCARRVGWSEAEEGVRHWPAEANARQIHDDARARPSRLVIRRAL